MEIISIMHKIVANLSSCTRLLLFVKWPLNKGTGPRILDPGLFHLVSLLGCFDLFDPTADSPCNF